MQRHPTSGTLELGINVMRNSKFSLVAIQASLTLVLTGLGVTLLYVAADYATQGVIA